MTDPRERIARSPSAEPVIEKPVLDLPVKRRPRVSEGPNPNRSWTRHGFRDADVQRLAALVRGGASYKEAAAEFRDVDPAALEAFKAHVIKLAEEPGPVARIASPEPDDDLLFFRASEAPEQIKVIRSTGRR